MISRMEIAGCASLVGQVMCMYDKAHQVKKYICILIDSVHLPLKYKTISYQV